MTKEYLRWSQLTELEPWDLHSVPSEAGVYILTTISVDQRRRFPFYAGQARDLRSRLGQHRVDSETNACVREKLRKYRVLFWCAPVAASSLRDGIERYLIAQIPDGCNEHSGPDVGPVAVNLPWQ